LPASHFYLHVASDSHLVALYGNINPRIHIPPYLWCMILIEYLLLFLVGYFFFRLISNVILPVMRTVRVVRQEFHRQADGTQEGPMGPGGGTMGRGAAGGRQGYGQNGNAPNPQSPKSAPNWDKMGDYIDFEEVK
jgi:hypothetical protein